MEPRARGGAVAMRPPTPRRERPAGRGRPAAGAERGPGDASRGPASRPGSAARGAHFGSARRWEEPAAAAAAGERGPAPAPGSALRADRRAPRRRAARRARGGGAADGGAADGWKAVRPRSGAAVISPAPPPRPASAPPASAPGGGPSRPASPRAPPARPSAAFAPPSSRPASRAASPAPAPAPRGGPPGGDRPPAAGPGRGAPRGPLLGPGPAEARRERLRALAKRAVERQFGADGRRGPGYAAGAAEVHALGGRAPALSTVGRARAAGMGGPPRWPEPRDDAGGGAALDAAPAKDAVLARAPAFGFGTAPRGERRRSDGAGGSEGGAGGSEGGAGDPGPGTRGGDPTRGRAGVGVVGWRAPDPASGRARGRREVLERIDAARAEALELLQLADGHAPGGGGGDGPGGTEARRPAWDFGAPPGPPPAGAGERDGRDYDPRPGAVRPRAGGAVEWAREREAEAAAARGRARRALLDGPDRAALGLASRSLDGAAGLPARHVPGPDLGAALDRFATGLYRGLPRGGDPRGAARDERPEEALDRLRPRVRGVADLARRAGARPRVERPPLQTLSLDAGAARDAVGPRRDAGVWGFLDLGAGRPAGGGGGGGAPGPGQYEAPLALARGVEGRVPGGAVPRAGRGLDGPGPGGWAREGDALELDVAGADAATRARRAAHYDMAAATARPGPEAATGAPARWEYPAADVGDGVRRRASAGAPDMERAPGRPAEARVAA